LGVARLCRAARLAVLEPQRSAVHVAFYEFDSVAAAEAATAADKIKPLVADFDRVWGDRVPRRREILELVQEIVP